MEKSEIKKTIMTNSNPANAFRKISDEDELILKYSSTLVIIN